MIKTRKWGYTFENIEWDKAVKELIFSEGEIAKQARITEIAKEVTSR